MLPPQKWVTPRLKFIQRAEYWNQTLPEAVGMGW